MGKKNETNGEQTITFICKKFTSLGICDVGARGCLRVITKELTILNHPEAVRKKVCSHDACIREAKHQLMRKII